MKLKICAIYDTKAKAFQPPFFARNEDVAVRFFAHRISDKTDDIGRFPLDYNLTAFGDWDDETGKMDLTQPEILSTGQQMLHYLTKQEN